MRLPRSSPRSTSQLDSLGGDGSSSGVLDEALKRDFGRVIRWRAEFVSMGKALRGGAGWVLLTYSHRDRRLVNQWAADHTHALAGVTPILALDMYEHSYHLDYGATAEKYIDAFMETSTGRTSRSSTQLRRDEGERRDLNEGPPSWRPPDDQLRPRPAAAQQREPGSAEPGGKRGPSHDSGDQSDRDGRQCLDGSSPSG